MIMEILYIAAGYGLLALILIKAFKMPRNNALLLATMIVVAVVLGASGKYPNLFGLVS